jgi:hypothetical protein
LLLQERSQRERKSGRGCNELGKKRLEVAKEAGKLPAKHRDKLSVIDFRNLDRAAANPPSVRHEGESASCLSIYGWNGELRHVAISLKLLTEAVSAMIMRLENPYR